MEEQIKELTDRISSLEVDANLSAEIREQLLHLNYTSYLHLNSLTKQLIENKTVDKDKLALDMEELNELNEKLHKFSEPTPEKGESPIPEVTE